MSRAATGVNTKPDFHACVIHPFNSQPLLELLPLQSPEMVSSQVDLGQSLLPTTPASTSGNVTASTRERLLRSRRTRVQGRERPSRTSLRPRSSPPPASQFPVPSRAQRCFYWYGAIHVATSRVVVSPQLLTLYRHSLGSRSLV